MKINVKDNIIINYQDSGAEELQPIVFIHGNGGSLEVWKEIVESPKLNNFRTITFDIPGFGSSPHILPTNNHTYTFEGYGAILAELLVKLKVSNPILVGHSLGCNIILNSAEKFKDAKGIILTCASPIPSIDQIPNAYNFSKEISVLFQENISEQELLAYAKAVSANHSEKIIDNIKNWLLASDKYARMGIGADIPNVKNEWDAINNFPFPVALVLGELDNSVTKGYLEEFLPKQNLWNNKINYVSGAGHYLPLECPEKLSELIFEYSIQLQ